MDDIFILQGGAILKYKFIFNMKQNEDLVEIITHPKNEKQLKGLLNKNDILSLMDSRRNKYVNISAQKIESISSFTHVSKVKLIDEKIYFIKGRLKDLDHLKSYNLLRINNSQMINLQEVVEYHLDKGSRIILTCKSRNEYVVSRHYAKEIKEAIICGMN